MKNDCFSIVFINQKTKMNFSMTLSHWGVYIIILCLISLIISLGMLSYQAYTQRPYKEQLSIIHNNKNHFINMINALQENKIITDSMMHEYQLIVQYDNLEKITPILKPVDGIITQGISTNKKNPHHGIDIAASFNGVIYSLYLA